MNTNECMYITDMYAVIREFISCNVTGMSYYMYGRLIIL